MSTPQRPQQRLRWGILIHRDKLWISELYVYILILLLGGCIAVLSTNILLKVGKIHALDKKISLIKNDNLALTHDFQTYADRDHIATVLKEFTHNRLPEKRFGSLVNLVYESSLRYGYDPLLVLAVIHVESKFNPIALGQFRSGVTSGALGLMQIKFETAQEVARDLGLILYSPRDLLIPEINIVIGTAYLTRLIAQFKSFKLGVLAYNQGPGVIQRNLAGDIPLSIGYYNRVLRAYFELKDLVGANTRPLSPALSPARGKGAE